MSEWISVEERLPETNTEVLCYDGEDVFTGMMSTKRIFPLTDFATSHITHWMPLPAPPEE